MHRAAPVAAAREGTIGVVFATHDPHPGRRPVPPRRPRAQPGDAAEGEVSVEELTRPASGGVGREELTSDPERPPA